MDTPSPSPSPPDRLSVDPESPFYDFFAAKNVIVLMDGRARNGDVAEYCVSEKWVRIWLKNARGQFTREQGKPRTVKHRCNDLKVVWKPGVNHGVEYVQKHVEPGQVDR